MTSLTACSSCGKTTPPVARALGACADCLRRDGGVFGERLAHVHAATRERFRLPPHPPRDVGGVRCGRCVNDCRVSEGASGYCGVWFNDEGRLGERPGANLGWYHDPLPTNCVAGWCCPGGAGAGYPLHAHCPGPEIGYRNLAVHYHACTFNCLFCQNWDYRERGAGPYVTAIELAGAVDPRTACICFFGGDPTPCLDHALEASRLALERAGGRILRICWETNGSMNPAAAQRMARLSIQTGGCIKFDLKAFDESLHLALCGVGNRLTLDNFARLALLAGERPEPPLLTASTLLVPGYVDELEVRRIARFIAGLDPGIPYSLLGFHPDFFFADLPETSRGHAKACREAAMAEGLTRVRIGNAHLLGDAY